MLPRFVMLLALTSVVGLPTSLPGAEEEATTDEESLRAAHLPTDGPGLLDFFRKRTLGDRARARIQALIVQLGDDAYDLREDASAELTTFGPGAAALLRQALRHPDLEIRWRARHALEIIARDSDPELLAAAALLLGRRNPQKTIAVLLEYLPFAEEDLVAEGVNHALIQATKREGQVDPLLVRALTDKMPVKRAAAGAALCWAGGREHRPSVLRLLQDPDPLVRKQVALALVETRQKEGVPVLIALLTKLPPAEAERVDELLHVVAGDQAPPGDLDGDEVERRAYLDAWNDWWKAHGTDLELAKLDGLNRLLGHTVIAVYGRRGMGRVCEVDVHGKTRWHIDGVEYPVDAQVLDSRRVLITEYRGGRVTERNHQGEILWQTRVSGLPLSARRLANGRTFLVTQTRISEVNRKGDEVWNLDLRGAVVAAACRLPNGEVGVLTTSGDYQHLDRNGKLVKSFRVGGHLLSIGTHAEVLPNGHVLIPFYAGNRVVEYDRAGKEIWSVQTRRPTCAQRLPNGHTLISSRLSNVILEVDRKGNEVWTHRCDGRPTFAQRR
jgi:hypothetical protein